MVGAVSDKQDGLVQVCMQGRQDGQARGARQAEAGLFFARLDLFQHLLILSKRADFTE
jgi:hypothetical protein